MDAPNDTALATVTRETLAVAYDSDLIDRCVEAKLAGYVKWNAILRLINAHQPEDEQIAPETLQACLRSPEVERRLRDAQSDPKGAEQRRLRSTRMFHRTMNKLDDRVFDDKDKRTQMQAIGLRMGLAGHTPQTQISVGPNEDFLKLVEKALAKRSGANGS